ncbi:MFS transporter [Shigella boydii]
MPRSSDDPGGSESQLRMVPVKERSIAVGYFNVGSSIGAMIAPPLVVWAIVMHSWQMAFIIPRIQVYLGDGMAYFHKHLRHQKHLTDEDAMILLMVRKPIRGEHGEENVRWSDLQKLVSSWVFMPCFLYRAAGYF